MLIPYMLIQRLETEGREIEDAQSSYHVNFRFTYPLVSNNINRPLDTEGTCGLDLLVQRRESRRKLSCAKLQLYKGEKVWILGTCLHFVRLHTTNNLRMQLILVFTSGADMLPCSFFHTDASGAPSSFAVDRAYTDGARHGMSGWLGEKLDLGRHVFLLLKQGSGGIPRVIYDPARCCRNLSRYSA